MNLQIIILLIYIITLGIFPVRGDSHDSYGTLKCFTCNERHAACREPFDSNLLKKHLITCKGQCVKFKNTNDNNCNICII